MSISSKNLNTDKTGSRIEFDKLIKRIKNHLVSGLETLLDGMFDGADDTLFALAETADNNQVQQIYFETMRMLRLERTNIKRVFTSILTESFNPGTQTFDTNEKEDFDENELTLVDQDSLEEMVAITGMHTKAMQMFHEDLLYLGKRFEFIAEHSLHMFRKEAIEPRNICEAFRDAITPIGDQISIQNKLILYKLFDNKLLCRLGDLYRDINNALIAAGVMPKISVEQLVGRGPWRPRANETSRGPQSRPSETDYGRRLRAFDESNYVQYQDANPDVLDYQSARALHQFLNNPNLSARPALVSTADNYSTEDVLRGLTMLQETTGSDACGIGWNELKTTLAQKISTFHGGGVTRQVSQLDEKTIDLIQLLFDAMVEEPGIPDIVKSLLMRLQIPVVKCAMLDTEFFTNPHHPSRNLLNRLVDSGLRVSAEDDSMFLELEAIVGEVVEDFDQDVVSFQAALDKLNALTHEEEVKAREAEARTQSEVLRQHARLIVLKELKKQVRGRNFPEKVHNLVLKNWSTVMYRQYIRYGKNSDQWFESVDTLKEIMASLQSCESAKSSDDMAAEFSSLTHKLESQFLETPLSRSNVLDSLDGLKSVYNLILESQRRAEKTMESTSLSTMIEDREDCLLDGDMAMGEPPSDESCASVQTGDLSVDDGVPIVDENSRAGLLTGGENRVTDDSSFEEELDFDDNSAPTFPKMYPELDLNAECAEDIATAVALGLTDLIPELADIKPGGWSSETEDDNGERTTKSVPTVKTTDPAPGEYNAENCDAAELLAIDQNVLLNQLPEGIKPGVWINLHTGYREPEIRVKLSVVIPDTETLIFVDRQGFKSAEKQIADFLVELDEGLSNVVEEFSVFDKALGSVISSLRAY